MSQSTERDKFTIETNNFKNTEMHKFMNDDEEDDNTVNNVDMSKFLKFKNTVAKYVEAIYEEYEKDEKVRKGASTVETQMSAALKGGPESDKEH